MEAQIPVQSLDERYVMPTYARFPAVFVRGSGCTLWDDAGNEYLDLLAGVAVCQLGHCHPEVVAAIARQAGELMHCSNLLLSPPVARLGAKLCELSGMDRVFFGVCGATANETALKIAKKHGKSKRPRGDYEIVSLNRSFHGRTLGVLAATGQPKYQVDFEPMVPGFSHIEANDSDALRRAFSDRTAGIILEPIQGEAGVNPLTTEFMKEARALCDKFDAIMILDEVQTGMGRTGTWFHFQQHDIMPDVLALAKGLGSGMPIGACLARGRAADLLGPGSHGSTFGGNPLMCATGLAVIQAIEAGNLLEHTRQIGEYFRGKLAELSRSIVEVRGAGLMIGVKLERPIAKEVVQACFERRLITNATDESNLRIIPPLVISKEQVDAALETLSRAIEATAGRAAATA